MKTNLTKSIKAYSTRPLFLFAIAFLLQSAMLHAQEVTITAYVSKSTSDIAIAKLSSSGTVLYGEFVFWVNNEKKMFESQGNVYTTGGITIDQNKMAQMIQRGIYNPNTWTIVEPMKFIHSNFASNDYKARLFLQDSPRNNQLDITLPSGKTMTYHYNSEITKQISAQQQQTPAQGYQYVPNNNQPSYNNSNNTPTLTWEEKELMIIRYRSMASRVERLLDDYRNAVSRGVSNYELNRISSDILSEQQYMRDYRAQMNAKGITWYADYYETARP